MIKLVLDLIVVISLSHVASPSYTLADLPGMSYVACKYDEQWWVGMVLEADYASNGIKITFMHPHGPSGSFFWPSKDDVCLMHLHQ